MSNRGIVAIFCCLCILMVTVIHNSCVVNTQVLTKVEPGAEAPVALTGNNDDKNLTTSGDDDNNRGWPGRPVESLGSYLVKIGQNFVKDSRKLLLRDLEEFLALYAERPDKTNLCGIRFNHAYALWITIRYLNPTSIIESGVNAGQSTYFMRNASSTAMIYAIDPLDKPICDQKVRWMDPGKSEYFVGKTFQDIQKIDWQSKIRSGALDPNRTLVFLDDHRNVFKRFGMFMKLGMRHIMLEDNYKEREGATQLDKEGFTMKQMFARRDGDAEFLFHQLISYAEFPPLVPPIMARENKETRKRAGGFMHANDRNHDVVAPILRPDIDAEDMALYERICKQIRVDPALKDKESYMQLMNYNQICYMELRPMAPLLASQE